MSDHKAFLHYEETELFWFPDDNFECELDFMNIGQIFAIGLYNEIMMNIHFPIAFYQKLLNKNCGFDSLEELDPVLAQYSVPDIEI